MALVCRLRLIRLPYRRLLRLCFFIILELWPVVGLGGRREALTISMCSHNCQTMRMLDIDVCQCVYDHLEENWVFTHLSANVNAGN